MINEADTCKRYVVPRLLKAGWDEPPRSIIEQRTFTDGRISVAGAKARRGPRKRADYLLQYTRDFAIAVVEAKAAYKSPGTGLQQAKDYAEILGLKFAYATNGEGIVEFARASTCRYGPLPKRSSNPCKVIAQRVEKRGECVRAIGSLHPTYDDDDRGRHVVAPEAARPPPVPPSSVRGSRR